MTRRLRRSLILFFLIFLVLAGRLMVLQGVQHARWLALARQIQEDERVLIGHRGRIFDRNGVLLAQDVPALSIAVDNYHMTRPVVLVRLLQEHLGLSKAFLEERIYREGYFTWIARQVDREVAEAVRRAALEAGARGLLFIEEPKRVYPQGELASNVIGFVGLDRRGLEGVELAWDSVLRGDEAVIRVRRSAGGIELVRRVVEPGGPGADVVLTLDARVQRLAEEKLDAGVQAFKAKGGFVVVLDPTTGEVLAMAQSQRFDLNRYRASEPQERLNRAVATAFEPGSLFKVFAALAALEGGAVSLDETFDGDTPVVIAGHTFHNAESYKRFGRVTLATIIQNSINLGMIRVAQRLGAERLHTYLERLGFGRITGSGMPGEIPGTLLPLERWSALELGAVPIGQAVSVTGIQMASRMAALANGGLLLRPWIVKEVRTAEGQLLQRGRTEAVGRIASPVHVRELVRMMEAVVERGTGRAARIPGLSIAAKSGTAQKAEPGRGYLPGKYTSSFGGFFPAEDPRFLILVVLDEVGVEPPWGGRTAGAIFKEIARRLIALAMADGRS